MINNLFSIFDPSTSLFASPWILALLLPLILPPLIWNTINPLENVFNSIASSLSNEIHFTTSNNNSQDTLIIALFSGIALINVTALYPQIFSLTSHLVLTLPLSISVWLLINLFGWVNNTNHILSHLLPQGTPIPLMSFIVLIELSSNLIRPITLCVRLTANMIAGHLLITLLGNATLIAPIGASLTLIPIPLTLTILETAVAFIQSYVFITLVTLYSNEVN